MKTLSITNILIKNWPLLLEGTWKTLFLALAGTLIGLLLAVAVGPLASLSHLDQDRQIKKPVRLLVEKTATSYIALFRGTPMVVQAMIIFYSLSRFFGRAWFIQQPLYIGLLIISINTAAYIGEVLRGAISNFDQGQIEAARSLGLKKRQMLLSIIMPQVLRSSMPSIGNELIVNIKDSSVLFLIQINELFAVGRSIAGKTYEYETTYLLIALIYLVLTFVANRLLHWINRRSNPVLRRA